jgi:hypothetical protein
MATKQQIPVLAARLVEFQEEFSVLPIDDAQWVIMNGKEAAALCAKAIANRQKGILRLISGDHDLKLKGSDGSRLICQATDVFKFIDDRNHQAGISHPGIASPEMTPEVYQLLRDATFMDIFTSLPGSWDQKWIPEDKVVEFCKKYPHWLRQKHLSTFFLIKREQDKPINQEKPSDNLLIVCVRVNDYGLGVNFLFLDNPFMWRGKELRHVVIPQLPRLKI